MDVLPFKLPVRNIWCALMSLNLASHLRDPQWMQSESNTISNFIYPAQGHQIPCYRSKEAQWRSEQNDDQFLPFDLERDLRGFPFRGQQVWVDIVFHHFKPEIQLKIVFYILVFSDFDPHQVHTKYFSSIRDHQRDFRGAWTRVDARWTELGNRKSLLEIQGRLQQLLDLRDVLRLFPFTVAHSNHHDWGILFGIFCSLIFYSSG